MNSLLPLKRADLLRYAEEEGFPQLYKQDGRVYYGDVYDVTFEMESIILTIHFPRNVSLRSRRAIAVAMSSKTVNVVETERCTSVSCLTLEEAPESRERVLTLSVRRPIINHSYILLYELDS